MVGGLQVPITRHRKEPNEAHIVDFDSNQGQETPERRKNKPTHKDHPYKLYASNPAYQLVYCRPNEEPISSGLNFIST